MSDESELIDNLIRKYPGLNGQILRYAKGFSLGTLGSGRHMGNGLLLLLPTGIRFEFDNGNVVRGRWSQISEVSTYPQSIAIRIDHETYQFRVGSESLGAEIKKLWEASTDA